MNKALIFNIFIVAVLVLILFKIGSLLESDQDKIRGVVYSAKEATQKEQSLKCMSYISDAYNDRDKNNKANLFGIVKHAFGTYNDIFIEIKELEISVIDKTNASVRIICFARGKRRIKNRIPYILDVQKIEFDVVFKKEGNKWKVIELRFIEPENFLQLLKG